MLQKEHILNQQDTSIWYSPDVDSQIKIPAFKDVRFVQDICERNDISFTISQQGSGICALAMYMLFKGALIRTNDNVLGAVKQAAHYVADSNGDLVESVNFTAYFGMKNISIRLRTITDDSISANNESFYILHLQERGKIGHYVLMNGYDKMASSELDRVLVADPNGGAQRTLRQAMGVNGFTQSMSTIHSKRELP